MYIQGQSGLQSTEMPIAPFIVFFLKKKMLYFSLKIPTDFFGYFSKLSLNGILKLCLRYSQLVNVHSNAFKCSITMLVLLFTQVSETPANLFLKTTRKSLEGPVS